MKNIPLVAVLWTFLLAIPFILIALAGVAFLTEHATNVGQAFNDLSRITSANGQGWAREVGQRLPELGGMFIGQLVILLVLLFARRTEQTEGPNTNQTL
jgi:hypothetical protein